jgi:hypothetical protein
MGTKNLKNGEEAGKMKLPHDVEILVFSFVSIVIPCLWGILAGTNYFLLHYWSIAESLPHSVLTILFIITMHSIGGGIALAVIAFYFSCLSLRKYKENPNPDVWTNYRTIATGKLCAIMGAILNVAFLTGLIIILITGGGICFF